MRHNSLSLSNATAKCTNIKTPEQILKSKSFKINSANPQSTKAESERTIKNDNKSINKRVSCFKKSINNKTKEIIKRSSSNDERKLPEFSMSKFQTTKTKIKDNEPDIYFKNTIQSQSNEISELKDRLSI